MKKKIFISLQLALLMLAFIGCKKSNTPTPSPPDDNCKIITVTEKAGANNTTYNLSYNNEGKLSKITSNDFYKQTRIYNYGGNEVIIETYSAHWDDQLTHHTQVALNTMGLTATFVQKAYDYKPAGQPPKLVSTSTFSYEYNTKGEVLKSIENREFVGSPASEATNLYTWANGNIVKIETVGKGMVEIEYFSDKPSQVGDPLKIRNVLYNQPIVLNNRNLVKSTKSKGQIININYEFDDKGKISTVTQTGTGVPNPIETKYQYGCD